MDSNLKVGSNNAGLFIGNTEILRGGVTVNYEDGFFNDPGSAIRTFIAGDFSDLDYIVFIFNHNM